MASRYTAPVTTWLSLISRPTGPNLNDIGNNLVGLQLFSRKASDQTLNNTVTMTSCTSMTVAVLATEVVEFEFVVHLISPVAADIVFDVTVPAAATSIVYGYVGTNVGNLTPGGGSASGDDIVMGTTGVRETALVRGLLVNGANAGNIQLRFTQNAATVGDTIVYANSHAVGRVLG